MVFLTLAQGVSLTAQGGGKKQKLPQSVCAAAALGQRSAANEQAPPLVMMALDLDSILCSATSSMGGQLQPNHRAHRERLNEMKHGFMQCLRLLEF